MSGQGQAAPLATPAAPKVDPSQTGSVRLKAGQPGKQPPPMKLRKTNKTSTASRAGQGSRTGQGNRDPVPPQEKQAARATPARPAPQLQEEPEAEQEPDGEKEPEAKLNANVEQEPEAAPRPDPVDASPPGTVNPEPSLAAATPDTVAALEELDLRRSLIRPNRPAVKRNPPVLRAPRRLRLLRPAPMRKGLGRCASP
jgi:hypothetical protein